MSFFNKTIPVYIALILFVAIFAIGWGLGHGEMPIATPLLGGEPSSGTVTGKNTPSPPQFTSDDISFSIFWDAWSVIQDNFVDRPVSEKQLFYGALSGMVSALQDPYSTFFEPKVAEEFSEELQGRFEGIGAEIGIKNDWLTIISPLPESPAETAGLMAGDRVMFIDDFDTTGIDLGEAVRRIRGEKGTEVTLKVHRSEEQELRDIIITRDTIKIVSVRSDMKTTPGGKRIAYIKITNFHADTGSRFRKAVNNALAQGPDGFILDMRNNPGGFLDKAIDIASYWVPSGKIVVMEKFSEDNIQTHLSVGPSQLAEFPAIVLINGGSASGSEIVAGALQDHDLAQLVGQTSFGKGSVQDLKEFDDGSAIKITIAKWLTPDGNQIDKEGISPDVEVELTEEDYSEDRDPQLDRALELFDE